MAALRPYPVYPLLDQPDLMDVSLSGRWYYRVDIVDGFSRFLVPWSLNVPWSRHSTLLAETLP